MKCVKSGLLAALIAAAPLLATAESSPPADPPPPKAPEPTVQVTPYGFVQLTGYFDAAPFATKDYPGQASRNLGTGGAFLMTARYSRFGVRLSLDDKNWTRAKLGGEIEFDFKGGQIPTTFTTESCTGTTCTTTASAPSTAWYNAIMRLRLADVTATWKTPSGNFTLLAGQNWGIITPVFATSITWITDPLFWQSGKLWRRSPQLRATYVAKPALLGVHAEVAMLSPATADGSADFGSGNRSRWPDLEAHVGINTPMQPIGVALGVGYLSNSRRLERATVLKDVNGWVLAADGDITSKFIEAKGEWFYQKAADDTYNADAPATGTGTALFDRIRSNGFWVQGILKPLPIVWLHGGYGREKVNRDDLTAGLQTDPTKIRERNSQVAFGIIFNAGKYWKFGAETARTETRYYDGLEREAWQIAGSTQFIF